MLRAIIFDMDGVLVDSVPIVWKSFNELLKNEGVFFDEEYIKKNYARSLRYLLDDWKKEFNIKNYSVEEFSRKAGKIQFELSKNQKPCKELIDLLEQAKKNNIKCAVATSSMKWRAQKMLGLLKIRNFFQVLVAAEDVKKHKPDPEPFLETAKRLGVKPEECVVFEDAGGGVMAAKKAGMKAVGFCTKYGSEQELGQADLVIKDFKEVSLEKLKKLF